MQVAFGRAFQVQTNGLVDRLKPFRAMIVRGRTCYGMSRRSSSSSSRGAAGATAVLRHEWTAGRSGRNSSSTARGASQNARLQHLAVSSAHPAKFAPNEFLPKLPSSQLEFGSSGPAIPWLNQPLLVVRRGLAARPPSVGGRPRVARAFIFSSRNGSSGVQRKGDQHLARQFLAAVEGQEQLSHKMCRLSITRKSGRQTYSLPHAMLRQASVTTGGRWRGYEQKPGGAVNAQIDGHAAPK